MVCFDRPVPYAAATALQESVHAARLAGDAPDTLLVLQHPPVITLGRRGRDRHLLAPREEIERRGIEVFTASRGGDVTYHGPGQWVLYPILRLSGAGGAHGYLWRLEETAIRAAADFGVRAFRRDGMSGAWTDAGKIAAIGFHVKRGVTLHGMSVNVRGELAGFGAIVACGLVGQPVASLETAMGAGAPDMAAAREALVRRFAEVFGGRWERVDRPDAVGADLISWQDFL